MTDGRYTYANAIIGIPGAGKSHFVKELIKTTSQPKTLIIDVACKDFNEYGVITSLDMLKRWKKGVKRIFPNIPFPDLIHTLAEMAKSEDPRNPIKPLHMQLICDDATAYIEDGFIATDRFFRDIMVMRRHYDIDLHFVYHAFNMVQPKIYQLLSHITVFKTPEDENYVKSLKKIANQQGLIKAMREIKKLQAPEAHLPPEQQKHRFERRTVPTV